MTGCWKTRWRRKSDEGEDGDWNGSLPHGKDSEDSFEDRAAGHAGAAHSGHVQHRGQLFRRSVFRKFADSAVGDLSAAAYHYCPGSGNQCRCQHVHGETVCAEIPAESRGGSGNRHGSGIHDLAYICGSRGRVYASLCHDKREVSGGDRGRGDLRADRLHRQYWRVFRGKLDESTPVQGKYAAPDDRPDRWRAD